MPIFKFTTVCKTSIWIEAPTATAALKAAPAATANRPVGVCETDAELTCSDLTTWRNYLNRGLILSRVTVDGESRLLPGDLTDPETFRTANAGYEVMMDYPEQETLSVTVDTFIVGGEVLNTEGTPDFDDPDWLILAEHIAELYPYANHDAHAEFTVQNPCYTEARKIHPDDKLYQLMEIAGQEALFSNGRFDRSAIPETLYCYDIREDSDGNPAQLEPSVLVNHFGSILTKQPITFPEEGYLDLIADDDWTFTGDEMTLPEYLRRP